MSSPGLETSAEEDRLGLERLIFFSDAVFAIAITLLALDIRLPVDPGLLSDAALQSQLLAIWPKYLAYAISFLVIGSFWLAHHRRFRLIHRYDRRLLSLNLLLLMAVAFIPFPTTLISDNGNRTATIFYALSISLAGLLSAAVWAYAAGPGRLAAPLSSAQRRIERRNSLVIPLVFLVSILLAAWNADLAKFFWLVLLPAAIWLR